MRIDILTTFPELFAHHAGCALASSIPARARQLGKVEWYAHNLRDFTLDKHQKTDDRPFGGGPGMVMACQPIFSAVAAVEAMPMSSAAAGPVVRVLLTPQGERLSQPRIEQLASASRLVLLAGHYEGIDERVVEELAPLELSVGDYVLSGGELAAMVLMDAVIRLLPGVLGDESSAVQDSFAVANSFRGTAHTPKAQRIEVPAGQRLLDCPHYTKPRVWMGREVPAVLLSGDHQAIERWRLEQRLARTKTRRPDLL